MDAPREPPEGTIALLFTDIEGSTRLARTLGSEWAGVLADHDALVGGAIAAEGGFVDGTEGDAFFAAFVDAEAAARAAVQALRALRAHAWPSEVGELGVRMGLHARGGLRVKPASLATGADSSVGVELSHGAPCMPQVLAGGELLAGRAFAGDCLRFGLAVDVDINHGTGMRDWIVSVRRAWPCVRRSGLADPGRHFGSGLAYAGTRRLRGASRPSRHLRCGDRDLCDYLVLVVGP